MRWHVTLAMGLIAWGAYSLTRTRSRTTDLEFEPRMPGNGGTQPEDPRIITAAGGTAHTPSATTEPSAAIEARSLIHFSWNVLVPEGTAPGDTVYICGNHAALGHWNPMGVALHPVGNRLFRGELRMPSGTSFEYKFTRGSWTSVEVLKNGTHRPNRVLDLNHSAVIESEIEAWADRNPHVLRPGL